MRFTFRLLVSFSCAFLFFLSAHAAQAAVVYVNSSTGNDSTGDGSSGSPYKTFHKAYTSASSGDTIDLTGTFDWSNADETGDAITTGYTIAKSLAIQGQGADETFIQASSTAYTADRGVFVVSGTGINVTISDLTIRYGYNSVDSGAAGVSLVAATSLVLDSVAVTENASTGRFGVSGIRAGASTGTLTIRDSVIHDNDAIAARIQRSASWDGYTGGLHISSANAVVITNTTIFDNTSAYNGGIFHSSASSVVTLTNSTIINNRGNVTSHNYGLWSGILYIKNTIVANRPNTSAPDFLYNSGTVHNGGNNIIETQTGSAFTNGVNGTLVGDQASLNIASSLALNTATNGISTLALSDGSVAIDAGTTTSHNGISVPTTDARGLNRDATPDIGAFEYGAEAPDSTDPLVELTTPADGATVSGSAVTLTASSTDETSLAGVSFYIDGARVGSEDTSAPYSISWNTLAVANGSKSLVAVARDAANNYATSTARSITVSNDADEYLALHWKLDETTSGGDASVIDQSDSANHGTPTWAPAPTTVVPPMTGSTTRALTFNGSSQYVSKLSPTGMNTGTSERSIAGWIRVTDTAGVKVPFAYGSCGSGNSGKAFGLYLTGSEQLVFWGCGSGFDLNSATTVSPGVWTHVAATYDGSTVYVYKNGVVASSSARTLASSSNNWQVGAGSLLDVGGYYFSGSIDDVRMYNKALSTAEVAALAARTTPVPSSVSTSTAARSATVTWATNILGTTRLYYGITSAVATSSAEANTDSSATTTHSVSMSDLPRCVAYRYHVVTRSLAGDFATSSEGTFHTDCTGDATILGGDENEIEVASGGTVTYGDASIDVPALFTASSSAATFQINEIDAVAFEDEAGSPAGVTRVGSVFHLSSTIEETEALETFEEPIEVTLSYEDSDIDGLDESSLRIHRYDGTDWNDTTSCSVNAAANTVTCSTTAFSDFALFGDEEDEGADDAGNDSARGRPTKTVRGKIANLIAIGRTDLAVRQYERWQNALTERDRVAIERRLSEVGIAYTPRDAASKPTTPVTTASSQENDDASAPMQFVDIPDRDLYLRDEGDDVRDLQQWILDTFEHPMVERLRVVGATGYFGEITRAALAAWQTENGIVPAAGYYGPKTRAHIQSFASSLE